MTTDDTQAFIPYGRHVIESDDVESVLGVMNSEWLTTGPIVDQFEAAVAELAGSRHGVALSSGTAGLHAAMAAIGVGPGDEVIVPAMTFAATANAVVFQGATPVFADVSSETLLLDVSLVERLISDRTRAIVAVDFAGQPADYAELRAICDRYRLALVADASHALGATYRSQPVGSLADLTVFSFHPVKHITTGEGGMVVTNDDQHAQSMRRFRNHGIATDHHQRVERGTWRYEMIELGYNYRLTDIQSALGLSQLRKLPRWLARRRQIADVYGRALASLSRVTPLANRIDRRNAYHLYVVHFDPGMSKTRDVVFQEMRDHAIGVNVHYLPVHLHPFYRERFGTGPGMMPVAESAYLRTLSLPMHHGLSDEDVNRVTETLRAIVGP